MAINPIAIHFKRKFRLLIIGGFIFAIIILTIVYNHAYENRNTINYKSTVSFPKYLNDYIGYSSTDSEDDILIKEPYKFKYKSFNEKHPLNSTYSTDIRQMFSFFNINDQDSFYEDEISNLHIDSLVNYNFADKVIEKDILNHKFVPLKPYYKTFLESENQSYKDLLENKPYDMDPVLYWNFILRQVERLNSGENYIEFSWYDFINNVEYNNYLRNLYDEKTPIWDSVNCSFINNEIFEVKTVQTANHPLSFYQYDYYTKEDFIREHQDIKANASVLESSCRLVRDYEISNKLFDPKILQTKINFEVRPEVYFIQSMNRIFNSLKKPLSIELINIKDNSYKQLFVKKLETSPGENFLNSGLFEKLKGSINVDNTKQLVTDFESLDFTRLDAMYTTAENGVMQLQDDDFTFNLKQKYYELLSNIENLSPNQENYLDSLKHNMDSHYASHGKYFLEVNDVVNTYGKGYHHDHRFFRSQVSADMTTLRAGIMQGMLKTFTATLKSLGVAGWISHGNMYGWMYNGLPFPYDDDIDYQMPLKHLHVLAEHFNQSVLMQDPRFGNGRYFLDIGNLGGRKNGNGNNNIDGRLIDMDTGLYIDITGLSFNDEIVTPFLYSKLANVLDKHIKEENHDGIYTYDYSYFQNEKDNTLSDLEELSMSDYKEYIDRNFNDDKDVKDYMQETFKTTLKRQNSDRDRLVEMSKKMATRIHIDQMNEFERKQRKVMVYLEKMTPNDRYAVNRALKVVTCRNKHFTNVDAYKTLINTFYQQSHIILPMNYMELLHAEYTIPSDYDFTYYKGYMFQPNMNTWLKKEYIDKALTNKHFKPWNYNIGDEGDMTISILKVSPLLEFYSLFTLEETEILIFNMCDFDDRTTMTVEQFNEVVDITNWAVQFPQVEYRKKEISLMLHSDSHHHGLNFAAINKTQQLFADMYETMMDFELGKTNGGKDKLYKDSFEYLKDLEFLSGNEIYGYDMTEICRSHIFPIIQNLEDSKFKEVEFLGEYNFEGKDVWIIPGDNENPQKVHKSYRHDIYARQ